MILIRLAILLAWAAFALAQPAWIGAVWADDRKAGILNGPLLPAVIVKGEAPAATLAERQSKFGVPAMSVAVLRNGALAWRSASG